jgi:hypothetical protein
MDEDIKNNILHTVHEASSSNTTNKVLERDLSSGSEYILSDKEVDSGNINTCICIYIYIYIYIYICIISKYVQKYRKNM